jgi:hypothetical protein
MANRMDYVTDLILYIMCVIAVTEVMALLILTQCVAAVSYVMWLMILMLFQCY